MEILKKLLEVENCFMKTWPPESYQWYSEACKMFDYPDTPYGPRIKALISEDDTVLDLGSGIGAGTLMMASLCKKVIALDRDERALRFLEEKAKERRIDNIEIVHGSWPINRTADIVAALHVSQLLNSAEGIKTVFNAAGRGGFIARPTASIPRHENFGDILLEKGMELPGKFCAAGCYTVGALEMLGARVSCERMVYDFGQPLDTMEEAIRFIAWQTGADEQIVKKYTGRYVSRHDERYFIRLKRHSCAITFNK